MKRKVNKDFFKKLNLKSPEKIVDFFQTSIYSVKTDRFGRYNTIESAWEGL